jgi:hypothetical protein
MFNKEEYKNVVNVPYSVIIASGIIILITTGVSDENALKGLLGGYMGLGLGVLFLIMLNMPPSNWLDLFPFVMILGIIILMMYYLFIYFDKIAKGEVSKYYKSFSILSTIFLATQFIMLFSAMFSKSSEITGKLLSDKLFSLFALFGVINYLIVITIGVVLHFYSTQG